MTVQKDAAKHITPPQLLTVKEVLAMLSLSESKFNTLRWNGDITVIKSGRSVRVELTEVQRWIEAHRSES